MCWSESAANGCSSPRISRSSTRREASYADTRGSRASSTAGVDVGPQELFAAAALHGYAGRVEATAGAAILARRDELPPNCFLSINFSPDALLDPAVESLLAERGDLSGLVVEITEQTPVEDYPTLTAELDRLRAGGVMVAVDDTGAGYASLSHILRLRPHFVKVDRELVSGPRP